MDNKWNHREPRAGPSGEHYVLCDYFLCYMKQKQENKMKEKKYLILFKLTKISHFMQHSIYKYNLYIYQEKVLLLLIEMSHEIFYSSCMSKWWGQFPAIKYKLPSEIINSENLYIYCLIMVTTRDCYNTVSHRYGLP